MQPVKCIAAKYQPCGIGMVMLHRGLHAITRAGQEAHLPPMVDGSLLQAGTSIEFCPNDRVVGGSFHPACLHVYGDGAAPFC